MLYISVTQSQFSNLADMFLVEVMMTLCRIMSDSRPETLLI
jgi:hypothetical protein